jgi:hypothetical protein
LLASTLVDPSQFPSVMGRSSFGSMTIFVCLTVPVGCEGFCCLLQLGCCTSYCRGLLTTRGSHGKLRTINTTILLSVPRLELSATLPLVLLVVIHAMQVPVSFVLLKKPVHSCGTTFWFPSHQGENRRSADVRCIPYFGVLTYGVHSRKWERPFSVFYFI